MKVHELSFYSQFQCAMGNCPNTCCHGWQIAVDDETVEKYMSKTGIQGFRLRSSLARKNDAAILKGSKGKCPFLTKNRLCKLQLSLGEDYLPEVCRIFPRRRINYGLFAEESLFLSCPEASRLFLNNLDHLYYKAIDREVPYARTGTNDDAIYLQELLEIRSALTAQILDSNLSRPMLYSGLLSYAKALQQFYISNYVPESQMIFQQTTALSKGKANHLANKYALAYHTRYGIPERPDLVNHIKQEAAPFTIPHDVTYAMLSSSFYHIFLKYVSPLLYRLCRIYLKKFHRLAPAQGNAQLKALQDVLHHDIPSAERILRGYLAYYLLEEFLVTYENYSFLRNISMGIMHTHLLELFLALYYDKERRLAEEDMIQIITAYTRRGRHNDAIEEEMYKKLNRL